ncbi:MAG: hypothetical protein EXR71_01425 [Myxococcales bacterium]|nr:hypothetical protein [Myxococcales bacterium]
MFLALLFACAPNSSKGDTAGEAWPEWTDQSEEDNEPTPPGQDPDGEEGEANVDPGECEPDACIELAEAVDRGFATLTYGSAGLTIDNIGPYSVCFERWYTFLSPESQDAVGGTTDTSLEIPPDSILTLPYAQWSSSSEQEAWWCIEHNQYTASGATYTFNGARAPTRIASWTNDSSDEDRDGNEDHHDWSPEDGLAETQHSVWDYLDEEAVFIVGRSMNWFELGIGQSTRVVIEVTNLGRSSGRASISEKVPKGWAVSGLSPTPSSNRVDDDGATVLTWEVELGAAVEPSDTDAAARYQEAELEYRLTYNGSCSGREVGFAPNALWRSAGDGFVSEGAPLVVQCCGGEDGGLGGGP